MKRQIVSILGVFGLLLVAACANAQSVNVKANVPFDFVLGNSTLPAGAYSIESVNAEIGSPTLLIRNGSKALELVNSNTAGKSSPAKSTHLLFHRYGDKYFLSQIWMEGATTGRQFRMSRREAEIAKNLQPSEDVIVLAALR